MQLNKKYRNDLYKLTNECHMNCKYCTIGYLSTKFKMSCPDLERKYPGVAALGLADWNDIGSIFKDTDPTDYIDE